MAPRVRWVKLRAMQVPWPACVYADYSAAAAHMHSVASLRDAKPVLDVEDRVVHFLGVGPRAARVRAPGVAPNLQFCVAHEDDLLAADFADRHEFGPLCRELGVSEEEIVRTEMHAVYQRACAEAEELAAKATTDEEATEFFVKKLQDAASNLGKRKNALDESLQETRPSSTHKTHKVAKQRKSSPKKNAAEPSNQVATDAIAALNKIEGLSSKCWEMMVASGWETLRQGDGQELFKMPDVSFLDFRPNVNIFDTLEKACARYLKQWIKDTRNGDVSNQEDLVEFAWPLALQSGWQTMSNGDETWYIMPDTPFDKWAPNVTMFTTKEQAVAKFLVASGLDATSTDDADDEGAKSDATELLDESEEEEDKEMDSSQEEPETANSTEGSDSDEDVEEEEEVSEIVVPKLSKPKPSRVRSSSNPKAKRAVSLSLSPEKPPQPPKTIHKPNPVQKQIPPFTLRLGMIEAEIKQRGWFWKSSTFGYTYYRPHCEGKRDSELTLNEDYFLDQDALEMYLSKTGLREEIYDAYLYDHECKYGLHDDSSDDEDDEPIGKKNAKKQVQTKDSSKAQSKAINNSANKASAKPKKKPSYAPKRSVVSTSSRKRQRTSSSVPEVKFGEVWGVLSEEGWHYKPGKFEYDYFKPHCSDVSEGESMVDYFVTKDLLIDYLKTSGIWERVARQIAAEDESSEDDDVDAPSQATQERGQKRKSVENGGNRLENNNTAKKMKPSTELQTPVAKSRVLVDITPSFITEQDDSISPDATGAKETDHSAIGLLAKPRNLANVFTPSPSNVKKPKLSEHSASSLAKKDEDPVSLAIKRLTASYTPQKLRYRESEFAEIRGFFRQCFIQRRGASLYISGAPGCGKTALLKSTEGEIDDLHKECFHGANARIVRLHVNAMSLKNTEALFCELAEAVTNQSFSNAEDAFAAVETATSTANKSKRHTTLVLVLDEMDTLLNRNGVESYLCRLFELAHRPTNAFVLIGIANQVDFTERHLPLLKARLPDCRPRVLVFKAYTHETIEHILIDRLGGKQEASKLLNAHGLSFLARKIASTTGDIRLALDTCRRLLQHKTGGFGDADKENMENPTSRRPLPLTDMLRLIKHALESKSSHIVQSLPRNLQMILFASTRLAAAHGQLLGVDELYASYCDVCDSAGVLHPLSPREFRSSLDILSAESLVAPAELKKQLVKPLYSASELLQGFRSDAYFARLI